jgi:hypothetical protein
LAGRHGFGWANAMGEKDKGAASQDVTILQGFFCQSTNKQNAARCVERSGLTFPVEERSKVRFIGETNGMFLDISY